MLERLGHFFFTTPRCRLYLLMNAGLCSLESVDQAVAWVRAALGRLGGDDGDVVFDQVAPRGPRGVALPVVGHHGWFATVVCTSRDVLTPTAWQRYALVAAELSIWCVEHGLHGDPSVCTLLTPRQRAIASMAARGDSNLEIARALGISINTVKARLKDAFERLDVTSRIELAHVLGGGVS